MYIIVGHFPRKILYFITMYDVVNSSFSDILVHI